MGAAREATRSGGAIAATLALLASACGEYDVTRVKASLGDAQSQYEVSERYREHLEERTPVVMVAPDIPAAFPIGDPEPSDESSMQLMFNLGYQF